MYKLNFLFSKYRYIRNLNIRFVCIFKIKLEFKENLGFFVGFLGCCLEVYKFFFCWVFFYGNVCKTLC